MRHDKGKQEARDCEGKNDRQENAKGVVSSCIGVQKRSLERHSTFWHDIINIYGQWCR